MLLKCVLKCILLLDSFRLFIVCGVILRMICLLCVYFIGICMSGSIIFIIRCGVNWLFSNYL